MKVEIDIDEHQFGLACTPEEMQTLCKALSKLYGHIWCEAVYDPTNESTKKLCAEMLPLIQQANKILHFKK